MKPPVNMHCHAVIREEEHSHTKTACGIHVKTLSHGRHRGGFWNIWPEDEGTCINDFLAPSLDLIRCPICEEKIMHLNTILSLGRG